MPETKNKAELMAPGHPRWNEFIERLTGPEGCNFTADYDEAGEIIAKSVKWNCAGGNDKSLATGILERMGDIDIDASMNYFDTHGGHCDCEIIFNVDLA